MNSCWTANRVWYHIERIDVYNDNNLFGCDVDGNYSNYGSDVDRIDHILMGNRVSFKRLYVHFFVTCPSFAKHHMYSLQV